MKKQFFVFHCHIICMVWAASNLSKLCGVNITENKNSLHCTECCWLQAQAFRPVQLYFHPWKLAADIPVAAGFISYLLYI